LGAISAASLGYIALSGLWALAMQTLASVFTATIVSLVIGVPLGIMISEIKFVRVVVTPFLDFMQTMPAFVMLVPAVYFFGIGLVGGIVATIVFAMPLPIRLTAHGLSMVDQETVEAAQSFGTNRLQLLCYIKLPLAFRSVMVGVNQCIMLSLSVVITASFIGAGGLGDEIIRSISRLQIGRGIESGLAIVGLAIFLDRLCTRIRLAVDPTLDVKVSSPLQFLKKKKRTAETLRTSTIG
jgi:glycine betaine/proline transport system permease protein